MSTRAPYIIAANGQDLHKGSVVQDGIAGASFAGTVVDIDKERAAKNWAYILVDWQNGVRCWQWPSDLVGE